MKFRVQLVFFLFCLIISNSPLYATIKVGTEYFYPPFVISPSEGFDVTLMQTLCQRIKQDCKFIPMDFQNLLPALDSGKIDLAIGAISISLARLQKYIFSLPYLVSKGQFLILNNSSNIKSLADLKGGKIGVIKGEEEGSTTYQYLVEHDNNYNLIQYVDMEDLISALGKGAIAAAFLDSPTAVYWVQNSGNQFKTLGTPETVGQGLGIIALPANAQLITRLNQALESMEKDNSYMTIYNTYLNKI